MDDDRYRRVADYNLNPAEMLLFSDNKWIDIQQARNALQRIRRRYLREDELVLLSLKAMHPPKLDREVADIFDIAHVTANERKRKLYQLIVSYSWWLQNRATVTYLVNKKLGPVHKNILVQIIERKTIAAVANNLEITTWMVWKRMQDCLRFLRHKKDFEKFFRGLRMGYRL